MEPKTEGFQNTANSGYPSVVLENRYIKTQLNLIVPDQYPYGTTTIEPTDYTRQTMSHSIPPPSLLPLLPLTISFFLSGGILSISHPSSPALALAPVSLLLRQYVRLYALGKRTAPPIALASALLSLYLAYDSYTFGPSAASTTLGGTFGGKTALWLLSAACTIGIAPFTEIGMAYVNGELHRRATVVESEGVRDGEKWEMETKRLFKNWKVWNAVRGVLPLVGVVVGVAAWAL